MKNYIQSGDLVVVAAPAAVASGDFVMVGALFGVAQVDAAIGANVTLVREGVFSLAKATGAAWAQGDALFWDATAKNFTKTASGNKQIGVAFDVAQSGDTTGLVAIDEAPRMGTQVGGSATGSGVYTAIAADQTALSKTIATGLTTITAAIVQVMRAGKVATGDAAVSYSAGNLTVANGSTFVLTTNDVINWFASGV